MPKRKRTPPTTSQQEQLLQDFYDNLDNENEGEDNYDEDFVINSDESDVMIFQ